MNKLGEEVGRWASQTRMTSCVRTLKWGKTCLLEKLATEEQIKGRVSCEAAVVEWDHLGPRCGERGVGSDPLRGNRESWQGFKQRCWVRFAFNTHQCGYSMVSGFEEVRVEEGRPIRGSCRRLWWVTVFQKLLKGREGPLKAVHFRAKPQKALKQLSVSISLIPDGDTWHVPALWLWKSACALS